MLAIVRLRLKGWLLVALLAFAAQFGVTVSQVAPPRHPQAIVIVDGADAEESWSEAKPIPAAQNSAVPLPGPRIARPVASQSPELFQRPPPLLLLLA
jgi:hypothetical protein